jgi:hypothetical protein
MPCVGLRIKEQCRAAKDTQPQRASHDDSPMILQSAALHLMPLDYPHFLYQPKLKFLAKS